MIVFSPELPRIIRVVTFCLPNLSAGLSAGAGRLESNQSRSRKLTGREPNACLLTGRLPRARPTPTSLGKEANAPTRPLAFEMGLSLFVADWLVLRTLP